MPKRYLIGLLGIVICLTSCSQSDSQEKETSTTSAVDTKINVSRAGVNIAYQSCGTQDTTLLFVHGWCIDQSYWAPQVEAFCKDYQVVTMDLPGFGSSGKDRENWTVEAYGQDVAAVIDQLDLQNVILIGHSMGGDVILEAALSSPASVIALVGVDNFKDVGVEMTDAMQAEIDGFMDMMEQDYANTAAAYAQQALFHPSTDSAIVKRVTEDFRTADPKVATASLQELIKYGPRESEQLAKLNKKLYLINSDATPTSISGLDATGVNYEVLNIHATGHYPMSEKVAEFNQLLRTALSKIHAETK